MRVIDIYFTDRRLYLCVADPLTREVLGVHQSLRSSGQTKAMEGNLSYREPRQNEQPTFPDARFEVVVVLQVACRARLGDDPLLRFLLPHFLKAHDIRVKLG